MEQPKFVAYYRISRERKDAKLRPESNGLGLEAQRGQVVRYVTGMAGVVIADFTEIESGKRVTRPQLEAAIAAAKAGKATLIVAKLDRLARNARYLLKLRDSKLPITFCDLPDVPTGAVGNFIIGQMALVAEFERDRISERTKSALAVVKSRGKKLGVTGKALARRNKNAAYEFARNIRDAARMKGVVLTDLTIVKARDWLNQQDIPSRGGRDWSEPTTQRLLYRMRNLDGE